MKRGFLIGIVLLLVLFLTWFFGSGFLTNGGVYLSDYTVSEDGCELTMAVSVPSSIGYVRGYRNDGGGVRPHYLRFYNAFGGLNGSIGAKTTYTVPLNSDNSEIYFYRGQGGYELVLLKDESGVWQRP